MCLLAVALMVMLGGITRLTESGLSMVDWHPIHGIIPPLNLEQWQEEFNNYRHYPQYKHLNAGMTLEQFKSIFWMEYSHRILGRITGIIFFVPLVIFAAKNIISRQLTIRLLMIFILGGLQGLMGWYMVKSGLIDVPWVSPLRLMAHLALAFIIFASLWWHWLIIYFAKHVPIALTTNTIFTIAVIILLFLQILLGALVAGMDAGLLYDSFPLMAGQWLPDGILELKPWYKNLYSNPTTAHFVHRAGALLVSVGIITLGVRLLYNSNLNATIKKNTVFSLLLLVIQIALGAATVINHVPILLALMHQFVALIIFAAMLSLLYSLTLHPDSNRNTRHD